MSNERIDPFTKIKRRNPPKVVKMAQVPAVRKAAIRAPEGGSNGDLSPDQVDLLKRTICKDASDDELKLFLHICKRTGLDPFARQIYAVKRWDNKNKRYQMIVQTAIDGFRLTASRSGAYAGSDDPIFDNEKEPNKATVTVHKIVQGIRCSFTASARWLEYYPGDELGFMWKKMPCVMLRKVAEAQALRKAFPADLSGVYVEEEMEQADRPSRVAPEQPGEEDGSKNFADEYRIPFGKFAQRSLEEIDLDQLRDYVEYVQTKAEKDGKLPLAPKVQDFVDRASAHIAAFELSPIEPGSDG